MIELLPGLPVVYAQSQGLPVSSQAGLATFRQSYFLIIAQEQENS